jgi:hypothetical protein
LYDDARSRRATVADVTVEWKREAMTRNSLMVYVGVTGHREIGLQQADMPLLDRRIDEAIHSIETFAAGNDITLLSPLADGADQIVARKAVAAGQRLRAILPFKREAYVSEFPTTSARTEFDSLIEHAERVIEIDGSSDCESSRNAAYSALGRFLVDHSDVLLAIWDGEEARGEGGTGEIVNLALTSGLPVIWIAAKPPHQVRLLKRGGTDRPDVMSLDALAEVLSSRRPAS